MQLNRFSVFLFSFIISICLNCVLAESDADDCPDLAAIQPCKCDRQGLSCYTNLTEEQLDSVFQVDFKYKAYRSVWINGTPLKKLKANTFNGYKIFGFFLEENQLETIEPGAFAGSNEVVRAISLYDNQITSFPFEELVKMPKLSKLSLSQNKLTSIPSLSLATSLIGIDLSYNELKSLPAQAFFGLIGLDTIILSNNKLQSIPVYAFSGVHDFQLDLSNNEISSIDSKAFFQSTPVTIDLSGNKLTYLDPNVFEIPVRYLKTSLDVAGNPLSCRDCSKYRWLLNISTKRIFNFKCTNGRGLSDLTPFNIGCIF